MITADEIRLRICGDEVAVWLAESAVIRLCGLSDEYLRLSKTRYKQSLPASWRKVARNDEFFLGDNGRAWRYGYKERQFWYSYDNVSDKAPACYRSRLPSKEALVELGKDNHGQYSRERSLQLRNRIERDVEVMIERADIEFFRYWKHPISKMQVFDARTASEMAEAVAWICYIKQAIATKHYQTLGVQLIADFYHVCSEIIGLRELKPLLRKSGRSLRNRIVELPNERLAIREMMISSKYCNRNASIIERSKIFVNTETGEMMEFNPHSTAAMAYWMNFHGAGKHTKAALYKKYVGDMVDLKERPVARTTFEGFLRRWDIDFVTSRQRNGNEWFNKMMATYVPARKLEYANSLWVADASGTLSYRYYTKKGELKMRKLYTVLISDVASGYIVGKAIGREKFSSEDYNSMREAVASAVRNPLNEGREVLEFLSDNHGAYSSDKSKAYLNEVARVVRRISPHNSQGNPAERMFKLFKQSLRGLYNLYETSFGAKNIENAANPDYFKTEGLPTYEEAVVQLEGLIDDFNRRILADGTTPEQRFIELKNPACGIYSEPTYRRITQKAHHVEISKSRGFVQIKRNGEVIRYELPTDLLSRRTIAKYIGYRATVDVTLYENGEQADIYSTDGVFILTIGKTAEACMSQYEATDDERLARQYHERRKFHELDEVAEFERNVQHDFLTLRGGDRFGLAMATGEFKKNPKAVYNERQEEARSIAVEEKVKQEKRLQREAQKTHKQQEQEADDAYMAMIKRKLALKNNQKTF